MFKCTIHLSILLLLFSSLDVNAVEEITPSQVYSEARALEDAINKFSKSGSSRLDPIKLFDAKPLHVYAIATAVNEKVGILIDIEGLPEIKRPNFPNENIQPKDVLQLIEVIQNNILKLKPEVEFKRVIVKGKSPSDVLRILVRINLLLDNLVDKQLSPRHLYMMTERLKKNLTYAIVQSGRKQPKSNFELFSNVEPKDVFVNAENMFKTLMNTARLKFELDYPDKPYYSPYNKNEIQPYHVYTITVMNIVLFNDLSRRFGIPQYKNVYLPVSSSMTLAHIYAEYERILFLTYFFIMQNE